jgi:hypothetical protein
MTSITIENDATWFLRIPENKKKQYKMESLRNAMSESMFVMQACDAYTTFLRTQKSQKAKPQEIEG